WDRLREIYAIKRSIPPAEKTLLDVFAAAGAQGATLSDVLDVLALATGWSRSDLLAACPGASNLNPGRLVNAALLPSIQRAIALGRRLGVPVERLLAWVVNDPNAAQARFIKATVKAMYDDDTWLRLAAPIAE